jgi:hypothetical protein
LVPLDSAASFASAPSSAALITREGHANLLAVPVNALEAPDLSLVPGLLGDDPPAAPLDWVPSPEDIDAAFRGRFADDPPAAP